MINIKNGQGGGQMKLSKSVLIAIIAVAAIGCLNRTVQFVELCLILRQHSVHDGKAPPTFIKLPPRLRNNCAVPV